MAKPINYLKNVTKSIMYSAVDYSEDFAPEIHDFLDTNKDALVSTYAALRNPIASTKKAINAFQQSKVYKALEYGTKNTFEDLRSGKFYNKERNERDELKLSGMDLDDWDDLSEFGIESGSNKKSSDAASEITAGDIKVAKSVESSSAASTSAIVNATIASTEASIKTSKINTAMLYNQNEKLFGRLHSDVGVVNNTINKIMEMQAAAFTNMDKNMSTFFTTESKLSQERNNLLKQLVEFQSKAYTSAADKEKAERDKANGKKKKKYRWSDVNVSGAPDLERYWEAIQKNIAGEIESLGIPGFSEDGNMLAAMFTSPLRGISDYIVKGLIPATFKDMTKELSATVSGLFANAIAELANNRDKDNILSLVARVFGINTSVNKNIDTSKYEKGPVPFDGITRKAIIDVIPTYLRHIDAALTGRPESMFDYGNGKWIKSKDIENRYNDIHKNAINRAMSDVDRNTANARRFVKTANKTEADRFDKAWEQFKEYLYANNGRFNVNASAERNGINSSNYGELYRNYELIRTIYKNSAIYREAGGKQRTRYSRYTNTAASVLRAKDEEERAYRNIEDAIADPIKQIFAEGGFGNIDKHGKWKLIDGTKNYKFHAFNNIAEYKDDFGNTLYNYLQNMNRELIWQRQNWLANGYTFKGKKGKYKTGGYGNLTDFNHITLGNNSNSSSNNRDTSDQAHHDASTGKGVLYEHLINAMNAASDAGIDSDNPAFGALIEMIINDNTEDYNQSIKAQVNSSEWSKFLNKYFYGQKYATKDMTNKSNNTEDKEDEEDSKEGIIAKIKKAIDDHGTLSRAIGSASLEAFRNTLYTVDKAIYDMMYHTDLKDDEDKDKYDGFMGFLAGKISKTFKNISDTFYNNIIKPFKDKLGIGEDFTDRLKNSLINDAAAIANTFLSANIDIYRPMAERAFSGIKARREKAEARKNMISRAAEMGYNKDESGKYIKDARHQQNIDTNRNYRNRVLTALNSLKSGANNDPIIQHYMSLSENELMLEMENSGISYDAIQKAIRGKNIASERKLIMIKMFLRHEEKTHAAGTFGLPFAGNTMLSKGELLFNEDGMGMVNRTGAYNINKPTHILNSPDSHDLLTSMGVKGLGPKSNIKKDLANENAIKAKMLGGISNNAAGNINIRGTGEIDIDSMVNEAKQQLPETMAGGIVGAIASTLLGVAGGPLLGMLFGGATSLISGSENLKNMLFGKAGENGERDNSGFISKTIVDAVKKYAPDTMKYGLAGVIPGLLVPAIGPIGGLLIGGAIGFLKNNEAFTNKYFGENGKLTIKSKEKEIIDKYAPKALKGAALGAAVGFIFGGPFGILGNAAVGSALNMMGGTEEFKNLLLGTEVNGQRAGGILGAVVDAFQPIVNAGLDFKDKLLNAVDNNIIDPLSRFLQPAINAIPQVVSWLPRKLGEFIESYYGASVGELTKRFLGPITNIGAGLIKGAGKLLNPVTMPFRLIGKAGDAIRGRQIATMNADYMTAAERINWLEGNNKGDQVTAFDRMLANTNNKEDLDKIRAIRNNINAYRDNANDLGKKEKSKFNEIRGLIEGFRTAQGNSLSAGTQKAIRTAITESRVEDIPKILQAAGLSESEFNSIMGSEDGGLDLKRRLIDYKDLRDRKNMLNSVDKNDALKSAQEELAKLGVDVDLTKDYEANKVLKYIDTELTNRDANPELMTMAFNKDTRDYVENIVNIMEDLQKNGIKIAQDSNDISNAIKESAEADITGAVNNTNAKYKETIDKNIAAMGGDGTSIDEESMSAETIDEFSRASKIFGNRYNSKKIKKAVKGGASTHDFNAAGNDPSAVSRINNIRKILNGKIDKTASTAIAKLNINDYKHLRKRLKQQSELFNSFFSSNGVKPLSANDINTILRYSNNQFSTEFINKLRKIIQFGKTDKYNTITDVSNISNAATATMGVDFSTNTTADSIIGDIISDQDSNIDFDVSNYEDADYTDIPNHGIGTMLLGGLGKLGGAVLDLGKKAISGIGNKFGKNITKLPSAALSGIGNFASNAGNAIKGMAGNIFMTDEGPVKLRTGTDGSVEEDMTDPKTKMVMAIKDKKDKMLEKLQEAQFKASEFINKISSDNYEAPANDKKVSILSLLLTGGILYKTGILSKIFEKVVKPVWSNIVVPWWEDTARPWIDDKLTKIKNWITDVAIPWISEQIPILVATTVEATIKNAGPIIAAIVKGAMSGVDAATSGKDQKSATERGILTEDQVKTRDSFASPSGRVLGKVGNAAAHAFAQGKAGALVNIASNVGKFGMKNGGVAGTIIGGATRGTLAPVKAAGNAGNKFMQNIVKESLLRTARAGGEPAVMASNMLMNTANTAAAATTGAAATAKTGVVAKIMTKLKDLASKGINALLGNAKVQGVLAQLSASGLGKSVLNLKTKLINVFDDAIAKGCEKLGAKTVQEAAKKLNLILTIGMLVVDFTVGMDQAEAILGIDDPNLIESFVAGICNALCNLLILPAIVPGIPWIAQNLLEFFGDDLEERQKEADAAYEEYVKTTGDDVSKETYLKEQHSVTGKIGRQFRVGFQKIGDFITGKNKDDKAKEQKPSAISQGMQAISENAKGFGDYISKNVGKNVADMGNSISTGDFKGLFETNIISGEGPVQGALNGIFDFALKPLMTIPTAVGYIVNHITEIGDGLSDIAKSLIKAVPEVLKAAFTGDTDTFYKPIQIKGADDKENPILGVVANGIIGVERFILFTPMIITSTIKNVIDGVKEAVGNITTAYDIAKQAQQDATEGKIDIFSAEYWQPINNANSGFGSMISNITNYLYKIFTLPQTVVARVGNDISGSVSDVIDFIKDSFGNSIDKIKNLPGDIWELIMGSKPELEESTPETTGKGSYGRGKYSKQIDPSVAGYRFNVRGDSEYQTIGDSGCGPVAAVNAIESFGRGKNSVMGASRFALNGGYKEKNGGTRPEFFRDYFASRGYSSNMMTNKSQLASAISSGQPTVLMGSDARGTSGYTPYGKNPHYVTVTGVDGRGNAIVQDPESKYDNQLYPINSLLNKSKFGISAYGRGSGLPVAGAEKYLNDNNSNQFTLPTAGAEKALNKPVTQVGWDNSNTINQVNWEDGKYKEGDKPSWINYDGFITSGKVTNIPEGLGKTHTYMGWQLIKSKSSNQYKLREAAGQKFNKEGFGIINGRYVIASTSKYGNVGDYVDFYKEDGTVIPAIIGDIKSQNDPGCTEWGHSNGNNIVEFVVDKNSWYNPRHANPGTKNFHPEWMGKSIVKAVTGGSYYDAPKLIPPTGTNAPLAVNDTSNTISGAENTVNQNSVPKNGDDNTDSQPNNSEEKEQSIADKIGGVFDIFANAFKMSTFGKILDTITNGINNSINGNNTNNNNASRTSSNIDEKDMTSEDYNYTEGKDTGASIKVSKTGVDYAADMAHGFPYYSQGDARWANHKYGTANMQQSGCGPTSMAMVMKGFGINTSPIEMADWSVEHGYRVPNAGTAYGYFGAITKDFGLVGNEINLNTIPGYSENGVPVIARFGPGDFTSQGHFLVIPPHGVNGNELVVNDPGKKARTEKVWDYQKSIAQATKAWAFVDSEGNPPDLSNLTGENKESENTVKTDENGKRVMQSDSGDDFAEWGSGNKANKPVSVYGTYRDNLNNGRGSNVRSISYRRSNYGRATNPGAYTSSELNAIITALLAIADNTDKLNIIVSILNERLGSKITPEEFANASTSSSTRQQLVNQLNSAGFNKFTNAFDQLSSSSLESVMIAANKIASE